MVKEMKRMDFDGLERSVGEVSDHVLKSLRKEAKTISDLSAKKEFDKSFNKQFKGSSHKGSNFFQ